MSDIIRPDGLILVVEDSRTQAEFLGHILKKGGYAYTIAGNGREALEMVRNRRPACILTDIVMPEMDGYALCRKIREDPETAQIPVIMVTQLFDPADVLKGLEAGADNFIIKPFDPESVFQRISEVLRHREVPVPENEHVPVTAEFFNTRYTIQAGRLEILRILISTYDIAIRKNLELVEAQERSLGLNEELQRMVEELQQINVTLKAENLARQRAEQGLEQANKKLHLMTSITRHDLLNQLTVVQGYLDLCQMISKSNPEKTRDYIQRSFAMIEKTITTVKFTEDYQNVGSHSPAWHPVSRLVANSLRYANPGTIRVENHVEGTIEVFADPLIEKVIFNLIDNALRYGRSLTSVQFTFRQEGETGVLVCEDDGIGIPLDKKEQIFLFGYGNNTGMGLFLVREILAITAITIRETGTPGRGARFEMMIPRDSWRTVPAGDRP